MIRSRKIRDLFLMPFLVFVVLFIIVPIILLIKYGITDANGKFTFNNIAMIAQPEYHKALMLSILLSVLSTVICFIIAYPLCIFLAERVKNKYSTLFILFILPLGMNSLLSTMAWQTILEKNGVLNQFLRLLHLPPVMIINKPTAIVIGMIYNFLPYMILPLYNTLSKIDKSVIEAASDLGAGKVQTMIRIILPLSTPGIISGVTMIFIPSLTTFVISSLLGGNKILLIGNIIDQEFTYAYDWNVGSGLSMILMVFIIINMALTALFDKTPQEE